MPLKSEFSMASRDFFGVLSPELSGRRDGGGSDLAATFLLLVAFLSQGAPL